MTERMCILTQKMLQTLKSMPVERESEQSLAMIDEDDLAQGIGKNLWLI